MSSPDADIDARVEDAMQYLAETNRRICRQRALIRSLAAAGQPTARAETLLVEMLQVLKIMHHLITRIGAVDDLASL